jgi:hypothetical protein
MFGAEYRLSMAQNAGNMWVFNAKGSVPPLGARIPELEVLQ